MYLQYVHSRSSTPHLPTSVPPVASNSMPSSGSDPDPPENCGRRQPGLNYDRHHRRLSHFPYHDSQFLSQ